MLKTISEGEANIKIPTGKVTKKLPVFYNPVMKMNRDISISLLKALGRKGLQVALPLSGSGVRGIRMLTELPRGVIKNIEFNDNSSDAVKLIKKNIALNEEKLKCQNIEVSQQDANIFLLEGKGYDYIDVDPFGSPNKFLNSSIERLSRGGILAVTATDTAPLAGTYPRACKRKYWATPLRNELKHEIGLRILIRKVQMVGAQYDKALIPILSYSKDHYFRIFFKAEKSKTKCDEIIKQHQYLLYCPKCMNREVSKYNTGKCKCGKDYLFAGPLWIGNLFDKKVIEKMIDNLEQPTYTMNLAAFLRTILQESKVNTVGFYELHKIAKVYKIQPPKTETVIKKLKNAAPTHFSTSGIRTNKKIQEVVKAVK